ncbi:MAG: MFS transporter [Bacteroidota bacterium]
MLPTGISSGFVTVVLPYLLTQNNFPVSVTAGIVAFGVSANLWRFLWGPIVDISLNLKKWYWIGLLTSIVSLLVLCFTPFTTEGASLLSVIVFISQVAATFIVLPVNGFMAKSIEETKKGKASGWYQAGSLAGTGLGGGVGLWLATQFNVGIAGAVMCAMSLLFAWVIVFVQNIPRHVQEITILEEVKGIGRDILELIKVPVALFVIILIMMPIGTGAAGNLWSAIALDWHTGADTVILVTGLLSGGVSAMGCLAGGLMADRWGVWVAYFGSGIACACVAFTMAVMPMVPEVYVGGVLCYAFVMGMAYAAFTATVLFAIGKHNVATKFSLLASLGNLPVVYMTTINGWVHDQYSSKLMLIGEAAIGALCVCLLWLVLKWLKHQRFIQSDKVNT